MKESIVAVLTPLLVAFGMSTEQIAAIVAVIGSAVTSAQAQTSKDIETKVSQMTQNGFGNGVLAMLFQMAGVVDPLKLQAMLNGLAMHIAATAKADVRCQWDEEEAKYTQKFWAVDVPMDVLFGDNHVLRISMRGEVTDGTGKKALSIAEGRAKKDPNGFSVDCQRLAKEWMDGTWSKADQNIGEFLPSTKPNTLEEALPIMKEALSERVRANKAKNPTTPGKGKGRNANK